MIHTNIYFFDPSLNVIAITKPNEQKINGNDKGYNIKINTEHWNKKWIIVNIYETKKRKCVDGECIIFTNIATYLITVATYKYSMQQKYRQTINKNRSDAILKNKK